MNTSANQILKLVLSLILAGSFLSACGKNDPEKPGTDEPDQNETKVCDPADYCKNGGTCSVNAQGAKQCDCSKTNFTGDTCTEPKEAPETCDDTYCKNGGTCSIVDGKRSCDCSSSNYKGETCETPKTCKDDNPCKNEGQCAVDGTTGALTCDCSSTNYKGETCETPKTCKDDNPCKNDGQCAVDETTGALTCDCSSTNYKGETCDVLKTCEEDNPCQNEGKCSVNLTTKALVCDCEGGWGGVFCEQSMRAFKFEVKVEAGTYKIVTNPAYDYDYELICDMDAPNVVEQHKGDATCTYDKAGKYEVSIKGKFPQLSNKRNAIERINFHITKIIDWGNGAWKSVEEMFRDSDNITDVGESTPNFSQLTSMKGMFRRTSYFNGSIPKSWDTSSVTDMSDMFVFALNFNQDISSWNVSNVKDMSWMFYAAGSFEYPLLNWKVLDETKLTGMFHSSNVKRDPNAFQADADGNYIIDSPIKLQNILRDDEIPLSKIKFADTLKSISGAFSNRKRTDFEGINDWDTTNITNMSGVFYSCYDFDHDLSHWETKNVTDMSDMFHYVEEFNRNITQWDTTNVTNMTRMFERARGFEQNISGWNTENVVDCGSFDYEANPKWTREYKPNFENCNPGY